MLNHSTTTPCRTIQEVRAVRNGIAPFVLYASPRNKAKKRPHCKACHPLVPTPESRWQVMTGGMRKRLGYAPSVPDLRESLGEPTCCYLCGDQLGWDEAVVDHIRRFRVVETMISITSSGLIADAIPRRVI